MQVDAPTSTATALARLVRPKQWVKNVLVVAAPLAAGVLLQPDVLARTVMAFVCFCLAASATYLVNDVLDRESDRQHPKKRERPVAAGLVSPRTATTLAIVLGLAAIVIPLIFHAYSLTYVILGYLALQIAYVGWLKHEPVLDIACIAGGFLLRAIAGGAAANVPLSNAFLIVVGFGALFMAVGKRYSELETHDQATHQTRRALNGYTPSFLRMLLAVSASVTLIGYALWAFEIAGKSQLPMATMSVIPFTLALLRYARDIDAAEAEAPEDLVLGDRTLLVLGLIWLVLFASQAMYS